MVRTILPMVDGQRRRAELGTILPTHALGGLLGGLCVGAALGWIGDVVRRGHAIGQAPALIGLTAAMYALHEAQLMRLPIVQSTWQVPARWRNFKSQALCAWLYGLGLGVAFLTRIKTALYVVALWALIAGSPVQGAIVFGMFGLCRALPLWVIRASCPVGDRERRAALLTQDHPIGDMLNAHLLACVSAIFLSSAVRLWVSR